MVLRRVAAAALAVVLASGVAACSDDAEPRSSTTTTTAAPVVGTAGARGVGDPYFPDLGNGGYDVDHYDLVLRWDPDRGAIAGTTTVRALESAAATGALEGRTELFLHGEAGPDLVDVLMTNLHQPRSSLLVLIESFVGPRWRALYDEALREGYRFLSFGDAMLLLGERGAA